MPSKNQTSKRKDTGPAVVLLAILLILSLTLAPIPSDTKIIANIQPELLVMAAQQPDTAVQVIIQKGGPEAAIEAAIADLGGMITHDLPLINALGAKMSAGAAERLASSPAVQWISLNGAMATTQTSQALTYTTWATKLSGDEPFAEHIKADFEDIPINADSAIWFNSVVKVKNLHENPAVIRFFDSSIQFTANGVAYDLPAPDAIVIFNSTVTSANTTFDSLNNVWTTTVPVDYDKELFLSGMAFPAPVDFQDKLKSVTWTGRFSTDQHSLDFDVEWKWAAAVYSEFSADYNALGIKPLEIDTLNPYRNDNEAGTPENYKPFLIPGALGKGDDDYTGHFTGNQPPNLGFEDAPLVVDSALGPNNTYARGGKTEDAFSGFSAEITPGYAISKVEAILNLYAPAAIEDEIKLKIIVDGDDKTITLRPEILTSYIGAGNAGAISIDLTGLRDWSWADFYNNLTVSIDQTKLDRDQLIYYDAVGLRVTSEPGSYEVSSKLPGIKPKGAIDISRLESPFISAVRATEVWNEAPDYLQGQGITVAVIDSGVGTNKDLNDRQFLNMNFNHKSHAFQDSYGHGTFVANIIAGDGKHSKSQYMGIAPHANIINARVSDDNGVPDELAVIEALQWINGNKEAYNIRVVNLSMNAVTPQSYQTSPLCAAVEMLWLNGIVVVVSAGNNGDGADSDILYPPANDPFVITVGATDDQGTAATNDDVLADFSAYGVTEDGFAKPDLVAPGKNIVAHLPEHGKLNLGKEYPDHMVGKHYFRMSGTSFAAPIVSGGAVLLLQDEPDLTPDQVKYRLMATAQPFPGTESGSTGAGLIDIYAAVHGTTAEPANQGVMPHPLLAKMALIAYWSTHNVDDGADWESDNWGSVNWSSVDWDNVDWDNVDWDNVDWDSVNWGSVNWGSVNWGSVNWGSVNWGSVNWGSVNWGSASWDD